MGGGGENDGNYKAVHGWHTCHICLETLGTLFFALNIIILYKIKHWLNGILMGLEISIL